MPFEKKYIIKRTRRYYTTDSDDATMTVRTGMQLLVTSTSRINSLNGPEEGPWP